MNGPITMSNSQIVMSGAPIVYARTDVAAHATAANIWVANFINWSGTALTVSGFADAPQAGCQSALYMNAAHTFVNSGNLILQGGTNVTVDPGDWLIVRALSTTVFSVERVRVSPFASQATAQAGTNKTQALTAECLAATVIGMSQGYQDMSASRSSGVTYTNSTGRTIAVSAWSTTGGITNMAAKVFINGVQVAINSLYANGSGYSAFAYFLVPPGATYSVTFTGAGVTNAWFELR